jgi:hypothetical protein
MVQVVVAMMKTNSFTNVLENTKDKDVKVAKVPCTPTRMKPCDLDKTFEGSAFCVVNNHESMVNHKNLVGFLTQFL